jgi:murein DD-endopeptidase MepM/ murein hydrolase activator NlpD
LFKTPSAFQLSNLQFNLTICREYYKYIVIDTPSVWNNMTRKLYLSSDLNLIPVTLNALSTKSLRDYLCNVRTLARQYPNTRLRIIKNEVYGKQDSKLIGKTRTMSENRKFLENLCEQVTFTGNSGISVLPQSIIFDLEIPESAIVRNAQDEGMSIYQYQQHGKVNRAFDELARLVQYVLNSCSDKNDRLKTVHRIMAGVYVLAAIVVLTILGIQQPVVPGMAPRPVAPQQLVIPSEGVFTHPFQKGESLHKLAKYAICRFRATVPTWEEINMYVDEVITIHNLTRQDNEPKISEYSIPFGTALTFYPPMEIYNYQGEHLVSVYNYFVKLVNDPFAYVTGDWCERGTGGGQPHYGIDVACNQGALVYAPIDGEVVLTSSVNGGRTLGIVNNETVIFFCHLDKRFFTQGSTVELGQAIGTVGMTGRTSGPHAHIGYGIQSQSAGDMLMGKHRYRVTDPKLFFYREKYLEQVASR